MAKGVTTSQNARNFFLIVIWVVADRASHFHLKIKLQNGNIVYIKDINLGDILENGSIVESVMKINNKIEHTPLYIIKDAGVNGESIFVTGSHLVFDKDSNKFITVDKY